jgi:hypothetical protein
VCVIVRRDRALYSSPELLRQRDDATRTYRERNVRNGLIRRTVVSDSLLSKFFHDSLGICDGAEGQSCHHTAEIDPGRMTTERDWDGAPDNDEMSDETSGWSGALVATDPSRYSRYAKQPGPTALLYDPGAAVLAAPIAHQRGAILLV